MIAITHCFSIDRILDMAKYIIFNAAYDSLIISVLVLNKLKSFPRLYNT